MKLDGKVALARGKVRTALRLLGEAAAGLSSDTMGFGFVCALVE